MATRVIAAQDKTTSGAGDDVQIKAGNANTSGAGGSIILQPGSQVTTGGDGFVQIKGTGSSTILKLTESAYNRSFTWTQDYSGASLSADGGLGGIILFGRFYIDTGGKIRSAYNNYVGLGNSNSQHYDNWGYIYLRNDGVINWWGDAGLTYGSVGTIRVSNASTGGGSLAYTSSTPTALSTNPTNDLVLTGSAFQRLSSSSALSVTGIAPPSTGSHVDGRLIWLYNVGSFNITLKHSQTSTAANQFINEGSGDIVLGPGRMVQAIYDSTSSKWRVNGETYPYVFPTTDGTSGQVLTTNGSGTLSWGGVVRRTLGRSVTAGNAAAIARYSHSDQSVAILIEVDASANGHSGSSTYVLLTSFGTSNQNLPNGSYYKLIPQSFSSDWGDGSDKGTQPASYDVLVNRVDANTFDIFLSIDATKTGKTFRVNFTELKSGMTFTDKTGDAAISYPTLAGTYSTGGISGTTNYVPKFTQTTTIGNSIIYDTGSAIGINTTSPSALLEVKPNTGNVNTDAIVAHAGTGWNNSLDADTYTGLRFDALAYSASTGYVTRTAGRVAALKEGTWNEASGFGPGVKASLVFYTTSGTVASTSTTEKLRITSAGNVGIGTTSPGAKLQVDTGATGTKGQIIKAFLGQSANLSEWQNSSGTVNSWINSSGNEFSTNGINLTSYTTSYIKFDTSAHGLYRTNSWMGVGKGDFTTGFFIEASNYGRPNIRSAYPAGNGEDSIILNTTTSLVSSLSRIATFQNNGTTGAYILRDGDGVFSGVRVGVGPGTTSYNTVCGAGAWASNTTGIYSTAIGYNALAANTTGGVNTAIGSFALQSNTTGVYNTAVGYSALGSITTQSYNVAIGRAAISGSTGNNNTAVGSDAAMALTTGSNNVLVGYGVAQALTTGGQNVALGNNCLTYTTTSSGNIAIGWEAARLQADGATALNAGNYNVYIGYNVKGFNNSDTNVIVIGYNAIGKGANTTVIGNTSSTESYVYGDNLYLGNGAGSQANIRPLARTTSGAGSSLVLWGANGVTSGNGGSVSLVGGYGPSGNGGDILLRGGDSGGGTRDGTVISKGGGNGNYNCHEFRYGIAATYAFFDQLGRFCITPGTSTTAIPADATIYAATRSSATRGLIVKGAASQSANLTEWQDSTGTVVAAVSPTGAFTGSSFTPYGTINSTTTIFGNNYWTPNLSGVSNPSTGTFTKTTATAAWDSQVYSSEGYTKNVYCAARASQTNGAIMFGLNSDPAANASYSSLDYAWYFEGNSNLYIYENNAQIGSNYGTYTTSTVLSITYDGENVRYWKDGVLQRTVARSTGNPLYFDTSFYTQNASLNSVQFGPIGQPFGISGASGYLPKFTSQQTLGNSNVNVDSNAMYVNGQATSDLSGQIMVMGSSDNRQRITMGVNTTSGYGYIQSYLNTIGNYSLALNPQGGNVGIGTTSPYARFHVQQASAGSSVVGMILQNVGSTANTAVSLDFAPHETVATPATLARITAVRTAGAFAPTDLVFSTYNDFLSPGGLNERMRLNANGNLGIGTASPGAKLQVDTGATGTKGQIIKAVASQTANLSEWQNNSGTALSYVASNGDIYSTTSFVHYSSGNSGYYLKRPSDNATVASFTWSSGSVEASLYALAFLNLDVATGSGIRMGNWTTWADSVNAQVMWLKNSNIIWGNNALGVTGRTAFNTSAFQITAGSYATIPAPTSRFEVYGDSQFLSQSTSAKTVVVKAAASQTANLTEWQNNSGTALAYMDANGNFAAVTKSFLIPHPTPAKAAEGKKLRYASLEGPENGVYFRGTLTGENEIILPDYWKDLVDPDSITVNLTARKRPQPNLFVVDANAEKVIVESDREICCDFIVYATRKDIAKLEVEPDGN